MPLVDFATILFVIVPILNLTLNSRRHNIIDYNHPTRLSIYYILSIKGERINNYAFSPFKFQIRKLSSNILDFNNINNIVRNCTKALNICLRFCNHSERDSGLCAWHTNQSGGLLGSVDLMINDPSDESSDELLLDEPCLSSRKVLCKNDWYFLLFTTIVYLNVRLVNIHWAAKLRLFTHFFAEYYALFKQEYVQVSVRWYSVRIAARSLSARQHSVSSGVKYCVLTSKPCNRPTSIMSLAALGTTCITCIACRRASISSASFARSDIINTEFKSFCTLLQCLYLRLFLKFTGTQWTTKDMRTWTWEQGS
ncbi:hypothetical protein AGLY_000198 [Aphis glycines]|uniref:Uncharacterized protein n=1 Tax=Aphis glycines TaxID=307491 RepID=A0A6G0U8V8_APHGL|nr:hypothetical protein AGLY_000198 [Aphis glycines]